MKRFIAMLLMLCSALLMTAAFAEEAAPEAKITVVEQRFINMEDNGRGFFFAKVQNTGDAAGYADDKGNIVLFDADGNIILTENYVHTKPSDVYLEPGEYAYVCESIYDDALDTAEVADCQFSIKAVDDGEEYEALRRKRKSTTSRTKKMTTMWMSPSPTRPTKSSTTTRWWRRCTTRTANCCSSTRKW